MQDLQDKRYLFCGYACQRKPLFILNILAILDILLRFLHCRQELFQYHRCVTARRQRKCEAYGILPACGANA